MVKLSKKALKIIEGKNFAHLATLMKDGSPQVTPIWVDHDGDFILVNTAEGRLKLRNVSRDTRVAISITDQKDPYTMVAIRGKAVSITTKGADEHIEKLSIKYLGRKYPWRSPGQKRTIIKIRPEHVLQD
ncbi:MAG: PPOX class F420-dependent oxidoreductase [Thaumarchaeota archaeon]|nr:PPOX class F420-dependent oxidoreductase [Nitrososphaerota archaeon]